MSDACSRTHKPCILVVDDEASVLVSLALLLKQSGFEVLSCDDRRAWPAFWPRAGSTWCCRT
jgi:FixJ family two-component response regulator